MLMQQMLDPVMGDRLSPGYGGRFYGVYTALVKDIVDPAGQGRIKVRLPWSPDKKDTGYEVWARLATMMAGPDRGSWFIPEENDEVLVSFEAGDTRHPFIVGMLWNGQDAPPESMDSTGKNNKKTIKTRNGITVCLDDDQGKETVTIKTPGNQVFTLKDGPGNIKLEDSNGNYIEMGPQGITLSTSAKLSIQASLVEVKSPLVNVDSGMSKFSGVVKSSTKITNLIASTTYTPGAGNIW